MAYRPKGMPRTSSGSFWSDLGSVAVLAGAFGFGYLVGERRTLVKVEKPAMRALDISRADGEQPTVRSVIETLEKLEALTVTDGLTGLRSRYRIQLDLALAVAKAQEHGAWLGMCLLDLDHFKRVNDDHGHDAGDAVLSEVGRRLGGLPSGDERVGRYGGEEFIALLPRSDLDATVAFAERAREMIQATPVLLSDGTELSVTVSIGAVSTYGHYCDLEAMADAADRAMYVAKDEGRDRVRSGQVGHKGVPVVAAK